VKEGFEKKANGRQHIFPKNTVTFFFGFLVLVHSKKN
jgi:hypothetical protein